MNNNGFTKVCALNELKNSEGKRFLINDIDVALFKINEDIFALNNICPHQHTALIYNGCIEDGCVICPAHGWKFQLKNGKMPDGRNGLISYPVKLINDFIYIKAESKNTNW